MKSFINKVFKGQKGSLTVEAALVLPIFICAVLTIGYLTKIVYIHEIVQHAIDEAANEMASSSYLYYVSGVYDIDSTLSDELEEKKGSSEEHINDIRDCYGELNDSIGQIGSADIKYISNPVDKINFEGEDIGNSVDKIEAVIQDISADPKGQMLSLAALIAKAGYDESKTVLGNALIKHYIKKYSLTEEGFKKINIDGLDFSSSRYFNNNEDVDVIVKYNVSIPLPIKFIDHIPIVQRATARAWMGGEASSIGLEEAPEEEKDRNGENEDNGKAENDEDTKKEEDKSIKVYVSAKGSKSYHRFGCYHIFKKVEALDLRKARELGLKPCKTCHPPIESKGKYTVFKSKRSDDGKYHKEGCIHLFKEIIEMDLDEAVKKYRPCKTCKPPKKTGDGGNYK